MSQAGVARSLETQESRAPKPTPITLNLERTPVLRGEKVGQVMLAQTPGNLPQGYYLSFLKLDGPHHRGVVENMRHEASVPVSLSALTITVRALHRNTNVFLCLDDVLMRGFVQRYEQERRAYIAHPTTIQPESLLSPSGFVQALQEHLKRLTQRQTGQMARIIIGNKLIHAPLQELTLL